MHKLDLAKHVGVFIKCSGSLRAVDMCGKAEVCGKAGDIVCLSVISSGWIDRLAFDGHAGQDVQGCGRCVFTSSSLKVKIDIHSTSFRSKSTTNFHDSDPD
jgi:hypothetical protein